MVPKTIEIINNPHSSTQPIYDKILSSGLDNRGSSNEIQQHSYTVPTPIVFFSLVGGFKYLENFPSRSLGK